MKLHESPNIINGTLINKSTDKAFHFTWKMEDGTEQTWFSMDDCEIIATVLQRRIERDTNEVQRILQRNELPMDCETPEKYMDEFSNDSYVKANKRLKENNYALIYFSAPM